MTATTSGHFDSASLADGFEGPSRGPEPGRVLMFSSECRINASKLQLAENDPSSDIRWRKSNQFG